MGSQRPRGFFEWTPRPDAAEVLGQVKAVLAAEDEALTARQIFYRLVARFGYDKTEQAYGRLCENLVKARRAQIISFHAIRDEKTDEHGGDWGYSDTGQFWDGLRDSAAGYRRPLREGQPVEIELWCEARGMGPSLNKAARPYGVGVFATGGFPGVTVTHSMAQRVIAADEAGQRFVFLHLGDYDPSGESIFDAMTTDALHFYAGESGGGKLSDYEDQFNALRVALTREQVGEHQLPTAPAKTSDSRSVNWFDETCQAEAMPPDLLAETVREALVEWTDIPLLESIQEKADEERDLIIERMDEIEF